MIENFAFFWIYYLFSNLIFLEFFEEMYRIKKCIVFKKKYRFQREMLRAQKKRTMPKRKPKLNTLKTHALLKCEIYYVPNCDSQLWVTVRKYLTEIVKLVAEQPHSLNQLTKRRHNKALSV